MASATEVLQAAYAFIRGTEANKAIASLTLDHLIQQQIDAIRGDGGRVLLSAAGKKTGTRISKLDMLTKIQDDIDAMVEKIEEAGDDPAKLEALGLGYLAAESESP